MFEAKRPSLLIGGGLLFLAAIIAATAELSDHSAPVTVPDETLLRVTLDSELSSNQSRPGDHFEATVSQPILVDDTTVIPAGTHVDGLVVDSERSGRLMGPARLQLALDSIDLNGKSYDPRTDTSARVAGNHKKRNWAWIGGGGGGGLLIGALAGGGKGALIGGPVGAGAGTTVAYLTGRKDIHLRPETTFTFRLAQPLTIDLQG